MSLRLIFLCLTVYIALAYSISITSSVDFLVNDGFITATTDSATGTLSAGLIPGSDCSTAVLADYTITSFKAKIPVPAWLVNKVNYTLCYNNGSSVVTSGEVETYETPTNVTCNWDKGALEFNFISGGSHTLQIVASSEVIYLEDGQYNSGTIIYENTHFNGYEAVTVPLHSYDKNSGISLSITVDGMPIDADTYSSEQLTKMNSFDPTASEQSTLYIPYAQDKAYVLPSEDMVAIPILQPKKLLLESIDPFADNILNYRCKFEGVNDRCVMSAALGNETNSNVSCYDNQCNISLSDAAAIPQLYVSLVHNDGSTKIEAESATVTVYASMNGSSAYFHEPSTIILKSTDLTYTTNFKGIFARGASGYITLDMSLLGMGIGNYIEVSNLKFANEETTTVDGKDIKKVVSYNCIKFKKSSVKMEISDIFGTINPRVEWENTCTEAYNKGMRSADRIIGNVKSNTGVQIELASTFSNDSTITFGHNANNDGLFEEGEFTINTDDMSKVEITFGTKYAIASSTNTFIVGIDNDYTKCMYGASYTLDNATQKTTIPVAVSGKYTLCVFELSNSTGSILRSYSEKVEINGTDIEVSSTPVYSKENNKITVEFSKVDDSGISLFQDCNPNFEMTFIAIEANKATYFPNHGYDYTLCFGAPNGDNLVEIKDFKVTHELSSPPIMTVDLGAFLDDGVTREVLLHFNLSYLWTDKLKVLGLESIEGSCPTKLNSSFSSVNYTWAEGLHLKTNLRSTKLCYCLAEEVCGTLGNVTFRSDNPIGYCSVSNDYYRLRLTSKQNQISADHMTYVYFTEKDEKCDYNSKLWEPTYNYNDPPNVGVYINLGGRYTTGEYKVCIKRSIYPGLVSEWPNPINFANMLSGGFTKSSSNTLKFVFAINADLVPDTTTYLRLVFPENTFVKTPTVEKLNGLSAVEAPLIADGEFDTGYSEIILGEGEFRVEFNNGDSYNIVKWFEADKTLRESVLALDISSDSSAVPAPTDGSYKLSLDGKAILPTILPTVIAVPVPSVSNDVIEWFDDTSSYTIKRRCIVPDPFSCDLNVAVSAVSSLAISGTSCVYEECTFTVDTGNTDPLPNLTVTVDNDGTMVTPEYLPTFTVETTGSNGTFTDAIINTQDVELYGTTYTITFTADSTGVKAGGSIPFTVSIDRPLNDNETLKLTKLKAEGASVSFENSTITFTKGVFAITSSFKYKGTSRSVLTGFSATIETDAVRYDTGLFTASFNSRPIALEGVKEDGLSVLAWVGIIGGSLLVIGAIVAVIFLFVSKKGKSSNSKGVAPTNKETVEMTNTDKN